MRDRSGPVAFNKAIALYHLERYREAAIHFRRCLGMGKPRCFARPAPITIWAIACSSRRAAPMSPCWIRRCAATALCLLLQPLDVDLLGDARHNLELASLLWLEARAAKQNRPYNPGQSEEPKANKTAKEKTPDDGPAKGGPGKEGQAGLEQKNGADPQEGQSKLAALGKLWNLADQDKLVSLPPKMPPHCWIRPRSGFSANSATIAARPGRPLENVKDW